MFDKLSSLGSDFRDEYLVENEIYDQGSYGLVKKKKIIGQTKRPNAKQQ